MPIFTKAGDGSLVWVPMMAVRYIQPSPSCADRTQIVLGFDALMTQTTLGGTGISTVQHLVEVTTPFLDTVREFTRELS